MRKAIISIVFIFTIVGLTACGSGAIDTTTPNPTESTIPATEAPVVEGDEAFFTGTNEAYKDYIDNWYNRGSMVLERLEINKDGTWEFYGLDMTLNATGNIVIPQSLSLEQMHLYMENDLIAVVTLNEDDTIHCSIKNHDKLKCSGEELTMSRHSVSY